MDMLLVVVEAMLTAHLDLMLLERAPRGAVGVARGAQGVVREGGAGVLPGSVVRGSAVHPGRDAHQRSVALLANFLRGSPAGASQAGASPASVSLVGASLRNIRKIYN